MNRLVMFLVISFGMITPVLAYDHRDDSEYERIAFQRQHPCPSTGSRHGHCPGYLIVATTTWKHGHKRTTMAWQKEASKRERRHNDLKNVLNGLNLLLGVQPHSGDRGDRGDWGDRRDRRDRGDWGDWGDRGDRRHRHDPFDRYR